MSRKDYFPYNPPAHEYIGRPANFEPIGKSGLPMPTDYLSRTSRADKLADDMHGLALAYQAERFGLSNRQRLALLRCCSMLAIALCGPEWNDDHSSGWSSACDVFMHELCEKDDCMCTECHFPDGTEPDQLEAA